MAAEHPKDEDEAAEEKEAASDAGGGVHIRVISPSLNGIPSAAPLQPLTASALNRLPPHPLSYTLYPQPKKGTLQKLHLCPFYPKCDFSARRGPRDIARHCGRRHPDIPPPPLVLPANPLAPPPPLTSRDHAVIALIRTFILYHRISSGKEKSYDEQLKKITKDCAQRGYNVGDNVYREWGKCGAADPQPEREALLEYVRGNKVVPMVIIESWQRAGRGNAARWYTELHELGVWVFWLHEGLWTGRADHRAYMMQEVATTEVVSELNGQAQSKNAAVRKRRKTI